MKLNKVPILASLLTAGAILINPVRAERLSGTIDDVFIVDQDNLRGELLEGHNVNAEGLNSDVTDANGHYDINSNSVIIPDFSFKIPSLKYAILTDINSRLIDELSASEINAQIPSKYSLPSGTYFLRGNNGAIVQFTSIERNNITFNPLLLLNEKVKELEERIKNKSKTAGADEIRNLTITGDGYHRLERSIDITDNTIYNPFMIPRQEREDSAWAYENGLETYIALASGSFRRPEDLPFNIYLAQSLEGIQDSVGTNWGQAIQSAITDAENNGELNWFNDSLIYLNEQQLQGVNSGVILRFTNTPRGGGHAYTNTLERYEDGTPYLWEVEINPWLSQIGANAVFRREMGRVIGLDDNAPFRSPYIMARESLITDRFHPQEKQALKLDYNINQRCETAQDKRDLDIRNRYR